MWTWTNWLAVKARESGKELLLLNLDETSIPVTFTHAGGNVMLLGPTKNGTVLHAKARRVRNGGHTSRTSP